MGEHHINQAKVMETNLRIEALRLANTVADATQAVERAEKFYEFLKGGS